LQRIVHQIKYNNASSLGIYMGSLMGEAMKDFFLHHPIELILPMPLHPKKEYARGYNQASLLCTGIAAVVTNQFRDDVLYRLENTATQTKKSRIERWENVAEVFQIKDSSLVHSKHILLVDDVITTGASAEACANLLLKNKAASVSICSLAYTI
jgi:ComF family protein